MIAIRDRVRFVETDMMAWCIMPIICAGLKWVVWLICVPQVLNYWI